MKKIISLQKLAIVALSFSVFASCSKDENNSTPAAKAKVMVVHASPDAPAVDLLVDATKLNTAPLSYLSNTGYLDVTAGTRNIKVNVANSSINVINADVTVESSKNYSIFAIDSFSKISAIVLGDDLTAPAPGKAHLRFVHLSPNAPAVDIAVTGGNVLTGFGNKAFKTFTAFTSLDSGRYNLEVRLANTTIVALPLPNITLQAGKIYTVFAKGFLGGTGTQTLGAEIIVNK